MLRYELMADHILLAEWKAAELDPGLLTKRSPTLNAKMPARTLR